MKASDMAKEYFITFDYDKYGYGKLQLHNDSLLVCDTKSRTGSINQDGYLVNSIKQGQYIIPAPAVDSKEPGIYKEGYGFKFRLWRLINDIPTIEFTRLLIHIDAGLPGTLGCIGIQEVQEAIMFRTRADQVFKIQYFIKTFITQTI